MQGILGVILVDGSLNLVKTSVRESLQLTLTGGEDELEFLQEKVDEIDRHLPNKAQVFHAEVNKTQLSGPDGKPKATQILRYRLCSNKLMPVYNLLYPNHQREITDSALELLGGRAMAWAWAEAAQPMAGKKKFKDPLKQRVSHWILRRAGRTEKEAVAMQRWIQKLTGAQSTIERTNLKPRLLFQIAHAKELMSTLSPYAPESRIHLFNWYSSDDRGVHKDGIELLHGPGNDRAQRKAKEALAVAQALRGAKNLSEVAVG